MKDKRGHTNTCEEREKRHSVGDITAIRGKYVV